MTSQNEPPISTGKTILLVDDDPNLLLLIKDYLEFLLEANVMTAENGREALEVLEEKIPDLIVSDVMMSEMDGYSLVEHIRQDTRLSCIPFILLSAKATIQDRVKGLRDGADLYLSKPFDPEELVAQIESILSSQNNQSWLLQKMIIHNSTFVEFTQTLETALKVLQEENRQLKEKIAKHSSKSGKAAKDSIIYEDISKYQAICGFVAHSLKGEFMHIAYATQSIDDFVKDSPEITEECVTIKRSIEYSHVLLQRLINYLEIGKYSIESVDILAIIKKVELLALPRLKSNIHLQVELDPNLFSCKEWSVQTNLDQVVGVLLELIQNAANAMRNQGGEINIYVKKIKKQVLISVKDDGSGIPDEIRSNLFKTQVSSKGGLGLGLFLSKRTIEDLQGSLTLKSSSEKGTEITILLPLLLESM